MALHLKNPVVYDGTGARPYVADVIVEGERIASIHKGGLKRNGGQCLDLSGYCLAPGFIDTHGHSDFSLLAEPEAEGKVLQGVTSEINGNCGLSGAPLSGPALRHREPDLEHYGISERWSTMSEYLGLLEARRPGLNVATLVGHGNLRGSAAGYEPTTPTLGQMNAMRRMLDEAMGAGALGMSTGLIYPPGVYSRTDELADLAATGRRGLGGGRFIYATHMRSEGDALIESVEEAVRIGRDSGAHVHISHIKTWGQENWWKIDPLIQTLERARNSGLTLTCDRYPYTAASTGLDSVLPSWVYEGGHEKELMRLRDPGARERLISDFAGRRGGGDLFAGIQISSVASEKNRWMEGLGLQTIASRVGKNSMEAVLDILAEEQLRVDAVFHNMSEENLRRLLSLHYVMVGTDSTARPLTARGKPHPRGFGSFPRYLGRYVNNLSVGIAKVTNLPASTFGLRDRGLVQPGFYADLVVFDPGELADTATYNSPCQAPRGILHVLVNGEFAVMESRLTGIRSGRVIRRHPRH